MAPWMLALVLVSFRPGDAVTYQKNGFDYQAHALETKDNKWLVHPDAQPKNFEEWVEESALKARTSTTTNPPPPANLKAGDRVLVLEKRTFVPAMIVKAEKDRWLIHYVYRASDYDEWVWSDRLRAYDPARVPSYEMDISVPGYNPNALGAIARYNDGRWVRVALAPYSGTYWRVTGGELGGVIVGPDKLKAEDYSEGGASDFHTAAVGGVFNNKKSAVDRAHALSSQLSFAAVPESLKDPYARPMYTGNVVSIYKSGASEYRVIFSLGDEERSKEAAAKVPGATLETHHLYRARTNSAWEATTLRKVVILASKPSYAEAKAAAEKISKAVGVPFSTRGVNINSPHYAPRLDNTCKCLSVERSSAYEGMKPNLFIVVGAIDEEADRFKEKVPDAYVKQLTVYYGCRN